MGGEEGMRIWNGIFKIYIYIRFVEILKKESTEVIKLQLKDQFDRRCPVFQLCMNSWKG